jgi:hypothetical protein
MIPIVKSTIRKTFKKWMIKRPATIKHAVFTIPLLNASTKATKRIMTLMALQPSTIRTTETPFTRTKTEGSKVLELNCTLKLTVSKTNRVCSATTLVNPSFSKFKTSNWLK